ncbi:three component ABC system middle component [Anaeromicropila herbilytica]|uniref:Uncharacterized protein n=1 Tax=Anaeromicropila herbilytica TaxID=2785025 RepID=A0A7R7IEF8_9FIRM|nr:three component ABC system middle component [Anaeromicropila herbilytica]BCN32602.1 hypothetical protein bsdtb5_38970 [Anaeromicropila herbilytica]
MISEYDNVRNPMLGAYILWNFILGYYSKNDGCVPFELLFIVLPMILKEDIAQQIQSTNKSSGMRIMSDKFMKTEVLKNDLVSSIHKDIERMKESTIASIGEAIKAGLVSLEFETNKFFPIELKIRNKEADSVLKLGKNAEKLGQWCAELTLTEIEEILKVRF